MKILITAPYHDKAQQALKEQFGEIIYKPWKLQERAYNESELIALLTETGAEALITEHDHVTSAVIGAFRIYSLSACAAVRRRMWPLRLPRPMVFRFSTHPHVMRRRWRKCLSPTSSTCMRNTLRRYRWLEGEHWEAGAHTSYLQFKGK
jgi:D-3-phosphoglycerate dehydrogenase